MHLLAITGSMITQTLSWVRTSAGRVSQRTSIHWSGVNWASNWARDREDSVDWNTRTCDSKASVGGINRTGHSCSNICKAAIVSTLLHSYHQRVHMNQDLSSGCSVDYIWLDSLASVNCWSQKVVNARNLIRTGVAIQRLSVRSACYRLCAAAARSNCQHHNKNNTDNQRSCSCHRKGLYWQLSLEMRHATCIHRTQACAQ